MSGYPSGDGFERWIDCRPAFDQRFDNPKRWASDYGRHGVEMRWVLRRPDVGGITWQLYTNWMLPETWAADLLLPRPFHLPREGPGFHYSYHPPSGPTQHDRSDMPHLFCRPLPADVAYHCLWPRDDDQRPIQRDGCDLVPGEKCYGDSSISEGDRVFVALLRGGSDAVWRELAVYYRAWIERCVAPEEERQTFGDTLRSLETMCQTPPSEEPPA